MKKQCFKIFCLVVVLLTAFSGFSGLVFADGEHNISVEYDRTLGSVEVTSGAAAASVETMADSIDYDSIWRATSALKANVAYKVMDGITITPAEDFTTVSTKLDFNSISFNGAIKGSNNGSVTESGVSGVVFKIDAERTGKLYFAVSLNSGKGAKAVNVKDINTYILDYTNTDSAAVNDMNVCAFDVTAGESYYFWPTGTKPNTFGAVFKEKMIVPAQTGDTVTVKAAPDSGNYIGNVRLGSDSVALTKNEGMTECTFIMPDSDIEVFVDFISKSANDAVQKVAFSEIKGANSSESAVYENLELFDGYDISGAGYADVSWESSNEEVISKSGEVNALSADTQVDFTAVFTWQDYPNLRLTKTFHLTVPADNDDNAAVAAAKDALTLGDTSAVKKNLELPASGIRHTQITWSSSNPDVVGADGKVNPIWEQSATVILTATISRGGATPLTKDFTIVVPAQYAITVNRIAVSNADGDVTVKPMDGGYVSHIIMTDNIPNKNDETLLVAVYDEASALRSAGAVTLKDISEAAQSENNGETILYLDKLDMDKIPVFDGCTVKVFAFDSMQSIKPATSQAAYVYNSGIVNNPTVYVAGDSTACTYPATGSKNRFPQTGWAAVLGDYFSSAKVNDLALSGRSSLDFRKEANYTTIKNNIKAGDYFIIQFGHNDEKNEASRYTNPNTDRFTEGSYKKNITDNYINIALDKGAFPIITTSISRRKEKDAGLEAYVNAAKELGYELGLPVVDLYAKVNGYINEAGEDKAIDLYNFVKPKDSRFVNLSVGEFKNSQFYSAGTTDNTHINYYGAQMISQWFCDELVRIGHPLTEKRNSHTTKIEDVPSYADAVSK